MHRFDKKFELSNIFFLPSIVILDLSRTGNHFADLWVAFIENITATGNFGAQFFRYG